MYSLSFWAACSSCAGTALEPPGSFLRLTAAIVRNALLRLSLSIHFNISQGVSLGRFRIPSTHLVILFQVFDAPPFRKPFLRSLCLPHGSLVSFKTKRILGVLSRYVSSQTTPSRTKPFRTKLESLAHLLNSFCSRSNMLTSPPSFETSLPPLRCRRPPAPAASSHWKGRKSDIGANPYLP